jgi:hypothetical protein
MSIHDSRIGQACNTPETLSAAASNSGIHSTTAPYARPGKPRFVTDWSIPDAPTTEQRETGVPLLAGNIPTPPVPMQPPVQAPVRPKQSRALAAAIAEFYVDPSGNLYQHLNLPDDSELRTAIEELAQTRQAQLAVTATAAGHKPPVNEQPTLAEAEAANPDVTPGAPGAPPTFGISEVSSDDPNNEDPPDSAPSAARNPKSGPRPSPRSAALVPPTSCLTNSMQSAKVVLTFGTSTADSSVFDDLRDVPGYSEYLTAVMD